MNKSYAMRLVRSRKKRKQQVLSARKELAEWEDLRWKEEAYFGRNASIESLDKLVEFARKKLERLSA